MALRDNLIVWSNSERSGAKGDTPVERVMPQPTVLSTVWEGPTGTGHGGDPDADSRVPAPDARTGRRSLPRWLVAPATGRRVVVITAVAALASGVLFTIGDGDEPSPPASSETAQGSVEPARPAVSSQAVAPGESGDTASAHDGTGGADPIFREAVSADERLRLSAESLRTVAGSWMLEARPTAGTAVPASVRFTVNGAIVEELDAAPYRLLLNPELLASLPSVLDEGQPLIVTASVLWPGNGEAASPATLVLPH